MADWMEYLLALAGAVPLNNSIMFTYVCRSTLFFVGSQVMAVNYVAQYVLC